jgi:hypothetical protein
VAVGPHFDLGNAAYVGCVISFTLELFYLSGLYAHVPAFRIGSLLALQSRAASRGDNSNGLAGNRTPSYSFVDSSFHNITRT